MRKAIQKIRRAWLKIGGLSVKQKKPDDSNSQQMRRPRRQTMPRMSGQCYESCLGTSFFFKTGVSARELVCKCFTEAVRDPTHSDFGVNYYFQSDDGDEFFCRRCGKLSVSDAECNCVCDSSCYGCLCSYRNQFAHLNLNRMFTFEFLNSIV